MNPGFDDLCFSIPKLRKSVEELVKDAGLGIDTLERLHAGGVKYVPVGDGSPLPILVRDALLKLCQRIPDITTRACAIVFVHSVPLYGLLEEDFVASCVRGLGLDAVPRIVVGGQPCAIMHHAIRVATARLEGAQPDQGILLLSGDVAYNADARLYFGAAMGDAALAGFLTYDQKRHRHRVLAATSQTHVFAWNGERSNSGEIDAFRRVNPSYIRSAVNTCLEIAGRSLEDLRFIIPHTPYLQIWDVVAPLLRVPRSMILTDYITDTGHLNSNDSFVHYLRAIQDGRLEEGDLALLINPGFGGSRGCTILEVLDV